MQSLQDMMDNLRRQREQDKQSWDTMDYALCMLCGAYGPDKRSLFIRTGYENKEVVPELLDLFLVFPDNDNMKGMEYLLMCKSCRARLLTHLKQWRTECVALRDQSKDHDGYLLDVDPESLACIPVRINGAVVMMTEDQYADYQAKGQG